MSEASLHSLERDVEAARSRFADSLMVLADPGGYAEAAEAAKRDVRGLKRQVEHKLQSTADGYLDGLKARAAANPAAVLAVAAGVAWRLFHKPPIATALVGAGLYNLLRTTPEDFGEEDRIDYTDRAKERLRQQMTDARDTVLEKAGELAGEAATAAKSLSQSAGETIGKLSAEASERAASASTAAARLARDGTTRGVETAKETLAHSARAISDNRDQALLGIAGVAVAAAIGVALNRRLEE
jgi:hypothetical protein